MLYEDLQEKDNCPHCNGTLENGILTTEQRGGSILLGGVKCSKIIWAKEFKMGFMGSPNGEDVSTRNIHRKYMEIPAIRCKECRFVVFKY